MTGTGLKALTTLLSSRHGGPNDTQYEPTSAVASLAYELERKAIHAATRRRLTENRWLADWMQYQGQYEKGVLDRIKAKGDPEVFVGLTRAKCQVLVARLWDTLFPTDLANWDVRPSPIPELPDDAVERVVERARELVMEKRAATQQETQAQPEQGVVQEAQAQPEQGVDVEAILQEIPTDDLYRLTQDEAGAMAERLKQHMRDILDVGDYSDNCQMVIEDAVRFGSGVLKGPVRGPQSNLRFSPKSKGGKVEWLPRKVTTERPTFHHIQPWDFFPDPEATTMGDCEYTFELHRLNRTALRNYAELYDFDKDMTELLLQGEPRSGTIYSDFIRALSEVEFSDTTTNSEYYYVWEYRGPLPMDTLRALMRQNETYSEVLGHLDESEEGESVEALLGVSIVAYFCEGELLAVMPNALESRELPYSVFSLDPRKTTLLGGLGIPTILRHPQATLNSAWRSYLRGGHLSALPMFLRDESVKPESGDPVIEPGKVWIQTRASDTQGLMPIVAQGALEGVLGAIEMAMRLMDDEAMIPPLSYGEPGVQSAQTAHGMVLSANAVNVVFKKFVKAFDRDVTTRNLRRLHEWVMLYGEDEGAKCDVDVVARGSSVLLIREVQAGHRMMVLDMVARNPALGDAVDMYSLARTLFESMQLPPDQLLRSREAYELARDMRQQAELAAMQGEEEAPQESQVELERAKQEGKMAIAEKQQETEMYRLRMQAALAELKHKHDLEIKKMDVGLKARQVYTEALLRRQTGAGI